MEGVADVRCIDRTDAGALVGRAVHDPGAAPVPVRPRQRGGVRRGLPGRAAGAGTTQDRLDARRGGGRSRPLAAAGRPRSQPLGCRRAARPGARLCPRDPGGAGCRVGRRRDRLPQAGHLVLRGAAAIHRLGRQDHQLPDRRVRRLRVRSRPRLHRSPALPAPELGRPAGSPACRSRARRRALRHQAGDRGRDDRAGAQGGRVVRLGCRRQRRSLPSGRRGRTRGA
jgi:hypothetical protein